MHNHLKSLSKVLGCIIEGYFRVTHAEPNLKKVPYDQKIIRYFFIKALSQSNQETSSASLGLALFRVTRKHMNRILSPCFKEAYRYTLSLTN